MSSSESEDENIKKFLEAADTTLINDAMFQRDPREHQKQDRPAKPVDRPKSNRYLVEEESVFQSDINVTDSMKKFVGKKLSAIIEQKITFVELSDPTKRQSDQSSDSYGVRLLRGSASYLKVDHEDSVAPMPRSKLADPVRKRMVEPDDRNEKEKVGLSAIEPNAISASTKCWTNRPKAVLYEYKANGSMNVIQEPVSEFTHLKRRNNWDESKIAKYRRKSKGR